MCKEFDDIEDELTDEDIENVEKILKIDLVNSSLTAASL